MKKESKKIFWIQILIICIVVVLVAVIATVTWIETYWSYIDENVFDEEPFSPNMEDDRFCVKIKDEYCEKFISGEMTIEDFGWDNIEKIVFWFVVINKMNQNIFLTRIISTESNAFV